MHRLRLSVVAAIALLCAAPAVAQNRIPDEYKSAGFFVGCQCWTWNHFTVFEAIEKTAAAGGRVIEFYPGQTLSKVEPTVKFDHNCSADAIQKVKEQLEKYHIRAVNYGVVGIPADEVGARKVFDFARALGLRA